MSSITHGLLRGIVHLLNDPSAKPNIKINDIWQFAFAKIYCLRAFMRKRPTQPKASFSPSHTVFLINPNDQNDSFFKIGQATLSKLVKDKDIGQLGELGGVEGIVYALQTNAEKGIDSDSDANCNDNDIARRHEAFGSNTYKKPPTRGFFHFVLEAFKDLTIFILLGCTVLSLAFGIKEHGLSVNVTPFWTHASIQADK